MIATKKTIYVLALASLPFRPTASVTQAIANPRPLECQSMMWSSPRVLNEQDPTVLRFPALAASHAHVVIAGQTLQSIQQPVVRGGTLSVRFLDGRDLGRPEGNFVFAYPRLIVDHA